MKEESNPLSPIEQFKLRIKQKGIAHQSLLEYLGISLDDINQQTKKEEKSEEIYQILKEKSILTNKSEFREFLATISHLWEMHQSKKSIKHKIERLFKILKEDIKNHFSEKEIFSVFRFCEKNSILLILVEQNILSIEAIIRNTNLMENNDLNIIKCFYPEIRKYEEKYFNELIIKDKEGCEIKNFVEENDQNQELFYEIRKEGKKEPKVIELIREDKIEEFISFVEHCPINLNEKITKEETIFEKNTKKLTLIEYSALFGSIAIFKYLYMKEVNINLIAEDNNSNNIIEYAIEGRNYQILHLLEDRKEIKEELKNRKNQQKYIETSIKMHYNEFFEYFITNYNIQLTEEIINLILIYRDYTLFNLLIERNQINFKDKTILSNIFFYICQNGNEEIVKILIKEQNLDINSKNKIFHYSFEKIRISI